MFLGTRSLSARGWVLCSRAIVLCGLSLVLAGCNEEECRERIPAMIKQELSEIFPCESRWPLLASLKLDLYSPLCLHQLPNDSDYMFHCGQHQYFTPQELYDLCLTGLIMYELECQAKERKLSHRGPRSPRVPSQERAAVD